MKKFLLLLTFFGFIALVNANAQCHGAKTVDAETKVCSKTSAAKLASMDDSIEERVCAKSGKVSYVKKSVCSKSGKVSFTSVEYCSKSGKFVNVSPAEKASCTKKSQSTAKATGVAGGDAVTPKSCCAGAAQKACCANKSGSAKSASSGEKTKVKLIKNEE